MSYSGGHDVFPCMARKIFLQGETSYEEKDYNKNLFHTTLSGNVEQFIYDCGLGSMGRRYGMLVLQPLPLG